MRYSYENLYKKTLSLEKLLHTTQPSSATPASTFTVMNDKVGWLSEKVNTVVRSFESQTQC